MQPKPWQIEIFPVKGICFRNKNCSIFNHVWSTEWTATKLICRDIVIGAILNGRESLYNVPSPFRFQVAIIASKTPYWIKRYTLKHSIIWEKWGNLRPETKLSNLILYPIYQLLSKFSFADIFTTKYIFCQLLKDIFKLVSYCLQFHDMLQIYRLSQKY